MISIIIIVKNDKGIRNTLNHLEKINKPEDYEVIVVDASGNYLNDIKTDFPSIRWIKFINLNKKKISIPEQRNLGIQKSRGEIIAFIDANCIPQQDWLLELIKPIRKDGEKIVSGFAKSFEKKNIHNLKVSKEYILECPTINMAFVKNITKKIGLFDERFNYGSDTDFSWRAVENGFKIRYNKKAVISHDWGNMKQEISRAIHYGEARIKLYKKHKYKIKSIFQDDPVTLFYPIFILFSPITILLPYYPLLLIIPFVKNIRNQPLKVCFINAVDGFGVLRGILKEIMKIS